MGDMPPLEKIHSPLQLHSAAPLPPLTPPTKTLILSHPSARLSSSPASSPRIIDSPPKRTRSVHPEMHHLIAQGKQPGPDFFDDSSVDDSEWEDEDDNTTRFFSGMGGLGLGSRGTLRSISNQEEEDYNTNEERGRSRNSEGLTALPPFHPSLVTHDSGIGSATEESSKTRRQKSSHARHVSLKRVSRVLVVNNEGSGSPGQRTPRHSSQLSDASSDVLPEPLKLSQNFDSQSNRTHSSRLLPHRRYSSGSIGADTVLEAHAKTMQALESMSTPSLRPSFLEPGKQRSFSEGRQVALRPIQTQDMDPNRPPHLPAHFIKTPYPFSANKEFPNPDKKQQRHQLEGPLFSHDDTVNTKGTQHTRRDLDFGPLLDASHGLRTRSQSDATKEPQRWDSVHSAVGARPSIVWLSLRRRTRRGGSSLSSSRSGPLEQIVIPSSLITTSPMPPYTRSRNTSRNRSSVKLDDSSRLAREEEITVGFDDMVFAKALQRAYKRLAGPAILRALSARRLAYIRIGRVSVWSGPRSGREHQCLCSHSAGQEEGVSVESLLAARSGLNTPLSSAAPFTEDNLLALYARPKTGKARYTWVHWARRVAATNGVEAGIEVGATALSGKDVTTIEFVHSFSPAKILSVLAMMLALAIGAVVAWVFFGDSVWDVTGGRGRAERVPGGILMGVLAGAVEGVVFMVWVAGSWCWL